MASFLASIDSLTGGRAFMDIGSGDSAVLNIGYKIATRARIEDYVNCVRGLLATGKATYQKRPQRGALDVPSGAQSHSDLHVRRRAPRCCTWAGESVMES